MTSPLIKEMKISTKMNELIEPVFRALVNKKGGNKKVWTKVCTLAITIFNLMILNLIFVTSAKKKKIFVFLWPIGLKVLTKALL